MPRALETAIEVALGASAQNIITESDRLYAVAERMLHLFSLEHEEITREPFDLSEVLVRSLRSIDPKAHAAQVSFKIDQLSQVMLQGDAVLVQSLITNLLDNAVKACSSGGVVSVKMYTHDQTAILQVADNGCGLTQEALDALGEPFYRPDKARSRKQGGAGLGVALCNQIAWLLQMILVAFFVIYHIYGWKIRCRRTCSVATICIN